MGLFDFVSEVGKKLFGSEDEGGAKIKQHIEEDNPGVDDLKVEVADGVAKIKGKAKDKSAWEKAILMAGNVLGINKVNADELEAPDAGEPATEYYVVQKGDSLWKIASKYYGSGAKYTEIFEANREVIKDPDMIYPGQKIRIPKQS